MQDLSLHILDIAENSIAAQAKTIKIRIKENREKDLLSLENKEWIKIPSSELWIPSLLQKPPGGLDLAYLF
jgi:hypothetical protein